MKLRILTILSAAMAALSPLVSSAVEELDPLLMEALENDAPITAPASQPSKRPQSLETDKPRNHDSAKQASTSPSGESHSAGTSSEWSAKPSHVDKTRKPAPSHPVQSPSHLEPGERSTGETFRNGRIGGWAGYVTGSDIEGGYTGRVELDCPILDYPCFISIRGEYLSTDGGDYTKTWKQVYGSKGYSHYIYTDKYTDATDTRYGGSAVFLWNPVRSRFVSIYGGIGFTYQKTKRDAEVSRVRVDNYTYDSGRHWGTSRDSSHFHDEESDKVSAVVFRVGSSLCLWDRDIVGAEVSYMPDLYEDASECELRGNYLWKYSDNSSLDFFFEYRTEAKIIVAGIGMSVWY